ncbi:MAG: hypothetical protein HS109_09690 [Burkholderiales bacterium]|nr:hypothetical protein [Burkholderiales bacterium]MCE7876112.1 hypothetical protein [Betaproteobacteria bacterium PRO3]
MSKHTLAVAVAATIVATAQVTWSDAAWARGTKQHHVREGTTTVHRSRGADGLTDRTTTGPNGKTQSVDRYRGADGVVDSTTTGPNGGTTTVDRSRNADGTIDASITRTKP